jgi:hypothetical protein
VPRPRSGYLDEPATARDGARLDTRRPGRHAFAVTATSKDGQTHTVTVAYTVIAKPRPHRHRAGIRIGRTEVSPARTGCAVERGHDGDQIVAVAARPGCDRARLLLHGAIAPEATGTVRISWYATLGGRRVSGRVLARIVHGRWRARLTVPGIDVDPRPPLYTITVSYGGKTTIKPGSATTRIRFEVEQAEP